jgi:hypothetical protein
MLFAMPVVFEFYFPDADIRLAFIASRFNFFRSVFRAIPLVFAIPFSDALECATFLATMLYLYFRLLGKRPVGFAIPFVLKRPFGANSTAFITAMLGGCCRPMLSAIPLVLSPPFPHSDKRLAFFARLVDVSFSLLGGPM